MYKQRILHNNMNVHTIQHIGTIQLFIAQRNNLIRSVLSQDQSQDSKFEFELVSPVSV